jgi:Fibronectin type III domain
MPESVCETRGPSAKTRLAAVSALLVAAVFLFAPPDASAQIEPLPGATDYCSATSRDGSFVAPKQYSWIRVFLSGSGRVSGSMYRTQAPCLSPENPTCPPTCQPWRVETVCEFHCDHNHIAPYPWWVQLVASPDPGLSFVRWDAPCEPIIQVPRQSCVVKMDVDHNVTAHFSATPDTSPPAAFSASASSSTSYTVTLNWTPSIDDQWLGGYEVVHSGSVRMARLRPTTTTYRAENLNCERTYTFRIEAYDTVNTTASNEVQARTGACVRARPVPNTVIHVKPPRSTRRKTAFFHFGSSGPLRATKFQCKLDRRAWRACSASRGVTYRRLKRGYHTFLVRAGNANGFDRTPARWRWRVR